MLSITECRRYLKDFSLTDQQIEEVRTTLYQLTDLLMAKYWRSKEKRVLAEYPQPDLNRCSMPEKHVSWTRLDDGGGSIYVRWDAGRNALQYYHIFTPGQH